MAILVLLDKKNIQFKYITSNKGNGLKVYECVRRYFKTCLQVGRHDLIPYLPFLEYICFQS